MTRKLFLLLTWFTIAKTQINIPDINDICAFYINTHNISEKCNEQLDTVCHNASLLSTMLDAAAKFPYSGISYGTRLDYGHFDLCMSIDHRYASGRILGEHCTVGLVIPDLSENISDIDTYYKLAVCRPNECSSSDFNAILNDFINLPLFQDILCQTVESGTELTRADVITIIIMAVCLALMIICSLYDVYLSKKQLKPSNSLYLAFSVVTNGKKLLQVTKNSKEQIQIFHGLRAISIMWIIAGHAFTAWRFMTVNNAHDVAEWQSKPYALYITASRLAVDTFFYISGFLLAYQYLKQKPKPLMAHIKTVPQMYIHRYLRLTPAVLMTYLLTISIISHFGSGPIWSLATDTIVEPCRKYWWAFFLYIQNYYNYKDDEMCLLPTWYLSADMQMFLLSPLIIIPIALYLKKPTGFKSSMTQMVILCIFFIAVPMVTKLLFPDYDNEYDTHSRLIDYCVGITLGVFMRVRQNKPFLYMINRDNVAFTNLLFWALTIFGMLAIVIFHHDVENNHTHVSQSVFASLMRPAWCIGLSWIIYACYHGYGGFVNWFLCRPIFQVVGKLTYCMYLLHLLVMLRHTGTVRTRLHFSDYISFYNFCGHYVITILVAAIWTLAFESPLIIIEKSIFARGNRKKQDELPQKLSIEEEPKRREDEVE